MIADLTGRNRVIILSCYHYFDDDFTVLLVEDMEYNLMVVLVYMQNKRRMCRMDDFLL